ncbi:hypothetical protein Bca4012_049328 [Brassica carinata]
MKSSLLPGVPRLRGSFPWARSGSRPASSGRFFPGLEGPVPALVSRRGRVASAWGRIEPGLF